MDELLLFGMNEAGELVHSERLGPGDKPRTRELAQERLANWHAVEVWDGKVCIVRLRRPRAPA